MPSIVVVGLQWGDEGKGKIVDHLAGEAEAVVRFQGGHNAGHTVRAGGADYKLHLVPSGILHPGTLCVLGNGLVVDLPALVRELGELEARGIDTSSIRLSAAAHLILPYHRLLDAQEETRRGDASIGTTLRGIGPAYRDKIGRSGLRVGDLADPVRFRQLLEVRRREVETVLERPELDWDAVAEESLRCFRQVASRVTDSGEAIESLLEGGSRVLFEGAQGTFLDVDHGTYPFVTSSNTVAGAAATGSGVGPTRIDGVLGVTKAYCTRVGAGPFPTELAGEAGDRLVTVGHEFGTTTGRRRRCGWLDGVMLRLSARLNGVTELAVTKLDVLDGFDRLAICAEYRLDGIRLEACPTDVGVLARVEARYEWLDGWASDTTGVRSWRGLPAKARAYLERVAEIAKAPIRMVSVGADREATVVRNGRWPASRRK